MGVLGERREGADAKFGSDALADVDQPVEDMRDPAVAVAAGLTRSAVNSAVNGLTRSASTAYRYVAVRRAGGGRGGRGVLITARACECVRGGSLHEFGSFDEPAAQVLVQQPLALRACNLHSACMQSAECMHAISSPWLSGHAICTLRHSGFVRCNQKPSAALGVRQVQSETISGTRGSSDALRRTQTHSDALRRNQRHSTHLERGAPLDSWQSLAINGNQWQSMAINGNQR